LAAFAGDFSGIRRFANRDHKNIVHWSTFDHGGHFAAHNVPNLFVGDLSEVAGSNPAECTSEFPIGKANTANREKPRRASRLL
jgi:hypothetical protein